MSKKLTIRPYARLITMLGDQLIKNEVIALVELVKNSYDADASWVKVSFVDFDDNFSATEKSKIVIEDDGCGMTAKILEKHWLNPATPEKLLRKRKNSHTQKGRIMQGEKGIGRFAIFKLGKTIKITTRRQDKQDGNFIDKGNDKENILYYDFSKYDDNFLTENEQEKELYLDDLTVELSSCEPTEIVDKDITLGVLKYRRAPYGTRIEISNLKTAWTKQRIETIQNEVGKLQPIFATEENSDFRVYFYKDGKEIEQETNYKDKLLNLLENKPVLKVTRGRYCSKNNDITFDLNGTEQKLSFSDPDIAGLKDFEKFRDRKKTECGDFRFEFYIFDFQSKKGASSKYYLDTEDKKIIKDHRIYLYRDDIRVMPYGDSQDDWLNIDISRGTIRANEFLSNDQVVGCVYITQQDNPKLIDKTNREGLIEEGNALSDLVAILRIILQYLRKKPFAQYLVNVRRKIETDALKQGRPQTIIEKAKTALADDKNALEYICKIESSYKKEVNVYKDRIEKTEDLAAVGLSVETASHDIMLLLNKTIMQVDTLLRDVSSGAKIDREKLLSKLTEIRGSLSFVETSLKDIQKIFPSTKSRTKAIVVKDIVDKVWSIYARSLNENGIEVEIDNFGSPVIAKTTDAVLLQVFINLFDNALYWLKIAGTPRKICIRFDGRAQKVIFSDNGPGIKSDDVDYIFEAFYSGKGQEGRGLGLYIAKQLLDRYDYKIDLAECKADRILSGANFVVEFVKEG